MLGPGILWLTPALLAQFPLLYKLHVLFVNTDACMALFITCFFWAVVRASAAHSAFLHLLYG